MKPVTSLTSLHAQRGIVLYIALIALVVMAMGVLAIQRSLGSATGVAGNIGFREQGMAETDRIVEEAITWLGANTALENNLPADGYYATRDFGVDPKQGILKFDWTANARKLADRNGIQRWYVIHRMCVQTGAPSPATCADSGNTLTQQSATGENPGLQGAGGVTPLYRITARTLGSRNAESMVQVITY